MSEAPFPITELRENSDTEALGWASAQAGVHVHSRNPPVLNDFPLTVGFAGIPEAHRRFGVAGDPPTPEDRYELAEHVHRTLWPKPAPKPIGKMTEDELFAVGNSIDEFNDLHVYRLLNGSCVHPFLAFVTFDQRSWGTKKVEAMRGAVRNAANRRGRYDYDTDTIKESE